MIVFEFQPDEREIEECRQFLLKGGTLADASISFLEMPVRLQVNGVELFESRPIREQIIEVSPLGEAVLSREVRVFQSNWTGVPILHFVSVALRAVRDLKHSKPTRCPVGESSSDLHFVLLSDGRMVTIRYGDKTEVVSYHEVVESLEEFRHRVYAFLRLLLPQANEGSLRAILWPDETR